MKKSKTNLSILQNQEINYGKLASSFNRKYFLTHPLNIEAWDVASIHTLLVLQKKNCETKQMIKKIWSALIHQAKGKHAPCCIHLDDEELAGYIANQGAQPNVDPYTCSEPEAKLLQSQLTNGNLELLNSNRGMFPILVFINESKQAFTNFKDLSKALKKRNMAIQVKFQQELDTFETLKASRSK